MSFRKPTDPKQWWCAPHCGPGTTDHTEECECGRTRYDCALETTRKIAAGGLVEATADGDQGDACFCSGFWCPGCGRFWAQDSCLERFGDEYEACDGAELTTGPDHTVACCCGRGLFRNTMGVLDAAGD